ncbi:ribulose-bisphosphate carboxylase small chain [Klebsormidium nitens]|uniref:Ribulose bisphosphate carboxylase small subunit, chloroplastic n=1 Tax=Klebsormidium nitens TaxID=105231 RepID=A0A1Y1HZE4_KLENI|nr:ribulose-bisphosphate carboxylase small chain [Klebsormidium nitens]|eukprot:GAQ81886.1 ribulose-bisphosphate carboxylase small chain [Klebsormidium nitens]
MASSIAVQSVSVASFATASAKASATSQSAVAAPLRSFSGLKQQNALSASSSNQWESKTVSNGARTQAMKVWTPLNNKKFETLSYLPPLPAASLMKQVEYLLSKGWSPCIEFDENGTIYREHHTSPGYYDGRYWTMWKLPLFGCTDAAQVLKEISECKSAYPNAYIRVLGFDRKRQVQAAAFIVYKPGQY